MRRKGDWLHGKARRAVRDCVGGRDGWLCHDCRKPFADPAGVTLDHCIPWSVRPMSKTVSYVVSRASRS